MKNSVRVTADQYGNVIRQTSNPDYGFIVLEQQVVTIRDNGFVDDPRTFKALISGKISNLKFLDYYEGKELPGNIIVVESTKPFNTKNPNKHLKINPKTGEILKDKNNQAIYRDTIWDSTGCKDNVLIPHVRSEYISRSVEKKTEDTKEENTSIQTSLFTDDEDIFGKDDNKEIVGAGSSVMLVDKEEENVEEIVIPEVIIEEQNDEQVEEENDEEEYEEELVEIEDDEEEFLFEI